MEPSHTMIIRGRTLPVPSLPGQQFFGGDDPAFGRRLLVRELKRSISLNRTTPFLTVGRGEDCDVMLPHADVSFRHAHLQLIRGNVYCIDLASRTGTFWSNQRRASGWLLPGQPVTIGPYTIAVIDAVIDSEDEPADDAFDLTSLDLLSQDVFDRISGIGFDLVFLNGRHRERGEQTWSVRQPITLIGRSPQCRLRLTDASVSRVHCSLMASPAGLWVTDLLGRGGTRVNGEAVMFHLLRDGDELGVGRFRFEVRHRHSAGREPGRRPECDAPSLPPEWENAGGGRGVSEDFVLAIMDRFSAMQQQMSAMNQQQMMFMGQLVGMMHQNHHELVQREMARIAEIGEQIARLQAEIGDRKSEVGSRNEHRDDADLRPPSSDFPPPTLKLRPSSSDPRPSKPDPQPDEQPSPAQESRHSPRDVASHTSLIERMAALERERNSRWKKIMRIVTGAGP